MVSTVAKWLARLLHSPMGSVALTDALAQNWSCSAYGGCLLLLRDELNAENQFHYVILSMIVCDNKEPLPKKVKDFGYFLKYNTDYIFSTSSF